MAWTQSGNIKGASGTPGASGASGIPGASGASGASGAAGSAGASGGTGGIGASGASGANYSRNISTITSNTTLGSAAATDYVVFTNIAATAATGVTSQLNFDSNFTDLVSGSTWTTVGSAAISTSTKKFGAGSGSFPTASAITSDASKSADFTFGTGAFCVEFWVRFTSISSSPAIVDFRTSGTNGSFIYLGISGTTIILFVDSSVRITSSSLSTGVWYHVALTRSGTSTKLFLDGTQTGSTWTDSTNYAVGSGGSITLGRNTANSVGIDGFIDDFRVTKGDARYTSNFTAPTAAFADPKTFGVVTFPTAVNNTNHYTLKNINSSDAVNLATTSSQTIDGAAPTNLTVGSVLRVVSDGSNWRTV